MVQPHYKARLGLLFIKFFDVVLVLVLFIGVREYVNFGHFINTGTFTRLQFSLVHFFDLLLAAVIWNWIFTLGRMYQFRTPRRPILLALRTVGASSLGGAVLLTLATLRGVTGIRGPFPLLLWLALAIVFSLNRFLVFEVLRVVRANRRNLRHVIIVGLNQRAFALAELLRRPELGYNLLGFVDQEERYQELGGKKKDIPFLLPLSQLNRYISHNPVDEIFLTLPIKSCYDEIESIIEHCAIQGIKAAQVNAIFDFPPKIHPQAIPADDLPVLNYEMSPHSETHWALKRLLDLVLSLGGLLLLSPLLLLVALLVLWVDGPPIFFRQERIGLNKRRFAMFKFRTMVPDAESLQASLEGLNEVQGAAFKLSHDPRVTRLGGFLRRSSIDELPQLINVLIGSMSLVGPRPLPIRDFEKFYNDRHRRRFSVNPGITGLWQVSGRSEIHFEEWMRLDLEYIDNWSLLLDIKILVKTIRVVFTGHGAR